MVHQIRKLGYQIEARNTNYSSMETSIVLCPPRNRSNTRTPFDDQWHESQCQQDRWRTDLKGTNVVKNLQSIRNNTIKFLIWTQLLPWSNACSNKSWLQPRLWTASGTSCMGAQPTVPGSWQQLRDAPSTVHQSPRQSRHLRFRKLPESFGHHLKTEKKVANGPPKNLKCRIESN